MKLRHDLGHGAPPAAVSAVPAAPASGTPSEVTGTISWQPEGSGTRELVEPGLRVEVPLIGGRLEKLLSDPVVAGPDAEHGVGVAYLKGN